MKKVIESFVSNKNVGLVGASRSKQKWGNVVMKELIKKDYKVLPINPNADLINNISVYKSVNDLPTEIENVIITLPATKIIDVINGINHANVKRLWISTQAGNKKLLNEIKTLANQKGYEVVIGYCPIMFLAPIGIHNFHRKLMKLFGKLPV